MRQFKDKDGREWPIDLTVGTALRVKQESGGKFNLFDPESEVAGMPGRKLVSVVFAEQLSDYADLWELIYHVMGPADKPSPEDFGAAMAGDCLIAAQRVLLEEWQDFFRGLQRRDLSLVLEKQLAYRNKAIALIERKIQDRLPAVDAKMESALNKSLGDWEASLDSTLARSPSRSSAKCPKGRKSTPANS